ncbi:MAG: AraC family ligand binding domain-containing protein [Solirubrobacterales bacterium]|nr:AraC family ligand binding domain-containing protein [Solirubrobacterales bacterium]MBV9943911.1 AraC family ligand binding domain-containing protein [Solirubrobacterales bacterium]
MAHEPPKVVHLDELESVSGPGSLTWRPVRLTLGIRAFGANAYTAAQAGQDVVEPHTEDPQLAHQELYFVAAGRARFTIDGESHDAPAGTYVFIPDPASHRRAVAVDPGTTVLSFGGPATFQPSAWEWAFRAAPLIRSDPPRARRILHEGLEVHPESASLHYNLACLEAVQGNREAALQALRRALALRPEVAEWARDDEDLERLRDDPEFRALAALP